MKSSVMLPLDTGVVTRSASPVLSSRHRPSHSVLYPTLSFQIKRQDLPAINKLALCSHEASFEEHTDTSRLKPLTM